MLTRRKNTMRTFIIIVSMSLMSVTYAQQNISQYISNSYITTANIFNSEKAISEYRSQIGLVNFQTDVDDRAISAKISYKGSVAKPGLLFAAFTPNIGRNNTIEQEVEAIYRIARVDDDESEMVKGVVKPSSSVQGGYSFNKYSNTIYFIIKSYPDHDRFSGYIEINDLTASEKKAFMEDFIEKTKFK